MWALSAYLLLSDITLKSKAGTTIYSHLKQVQTAQLERVMGIEPTQSAWKAEVLPLNYTRDY
jgi:hypothetical protein